jgi:WhiB family transcriptional regulator, redox-sensing transcriptional regulator
MFEEAADWRRLAACKGPYAELFFPPALSERKEDKVAREADAKQICRECPVIQDCLDYAVLIEEPHGIWGGLNEVERRMYAARQAVTLR